MPQILCRDAAESTWEASAAGLETGGIFVNGYRLCPPSFAPVCFGLFRKLPECDFGYRLGRDAQDNRNKISELDDFHYWPPAIDG